MVKEPKKFREIFFSLNQTRLGEKNINVVVSRMEGVPSSQSHSEAVLASYLYSAQSGAKFRGAMPMSWGWCCELNHGGGERGLVVGLIVSKGY